MTFPSILKESEEVTWLDNWRCLFIPSGESRYPCQRSWDRQSVTPTFASLGRLAGVVQPLWIVWQNPSISILWMRKLILWVLRCLTRWRNTLAVSLQGLNCTGML